MINRRVLLILTALFSIGLVVSTLSDSRSRQDEWRKEMWADQAGHYVYLPLVFNYNLDAHNFPADASKLKFIYLDENSIGIQLPNGSLLSADASQENQLWANKRTLKTWERFELIRLQGDTIALRAYNGKYVHVMDDTSHTLIADASENDACAYFVKKQFE